MKYKEFTQKIREAGFPEHADILESGEFIMEVHPKQEFLDDNISLCSILHDAFTWCFAPPQIELYWADLWWNLNELDL